MKLTYPTAWTASLLLYPMMFSWYLSKLFLSIFLFLQINENVVNLQNLEHRPDFISYFKFSFQFLKHVWEAHASKLKIYIFIPSIR